MHSDQLSCLKQLIKSFTLEKNNLNIQNKSLEEISNENQVQIKQLLDQIDEQKQEMERKMMDSVAQKIQFEQQISDMLKEIEAQKSAVIAKEQEIAEIQRQMQFQKTELEQRIESEILKQHNLEAIFYKRELDLKNQVQVKQDKLDELEKKFQDQISESKETVQQQNKRIEQSQKELSGLKTAVQEKSANISSLEKKLEQQKHKMQEEISKLEQRCNEQRSELSKREDRISQLTSLDAENKKQMQQKEYLISELKKQNEKLYQINSEDIKLVQTENLQLKNENRMLTDQFCKSNQEKDQNIQELEERILAQGLEQKKLQAEIAQLANEIEKLKGQVQAKESCISQLQAKQSEYQNQILQSGRIYNESTEMQKQIISQKDQKIVELQELFQSQKKAYQCVSEEKMSMQVRLKTMEEASKSYEQQIEQLKASSQKQKS